MRALTKMVYFLFAVFANLYGVAILLFPARFLSEATTSFHLAHNLREQGAAIIFLGLMSFWCYLNYSASFAVHLLLTFFTLLLSGIHWFDYFRGQLPLVSPVYNTAPFLIFFVLAIGRSRAPKT